jgi:superfamily II DNA or RNA helicase
MHIELNTNPEQLSTPRLYPYQENDINLLFEKMEGSNGNLRLLYQLPTGGGKTRIFSEIASRYIARYDRRVVVLTHRVELCSQTSKTLKTLGIKNKMINSTVKRLSKKEAYRCFVAMVETLKNRIKDGIVNTNDIGLVIIDEAHHNSFQKLLGKFANATIIGVTATPFSSDINLPMKNNYHELVVGENIASLIQQGFLAKPSTWRYDVELNTLKTGLHGDFTVSTSDELYSSPAMLELLLHAYESHSKNKKTLIFNNGIFTSKAVLLLFTDAGYPVRHLDNHTPSLERTETLKWFKKTKGAILTSVSILTTGFDEPSVQTVILNRATTSLTLYHQMIGRGSRRLPQKKTFSIIDLGNNTDRFGDWSTPVDWRLVFENPEAFYEVMHNSSTHEAHQIPSEMRAKFPNSLQISFDIQQAHQDAVAKQQKPKIVIRDSIRQHVKMVMENSETISEALLLIDELDKEITWRVKQYGKCLGRVTKNYTDWLQTDYKTKLKTMVQKLMHRQSVQRQAI